MANINLISARRGERVRLTKLSRGLLTAVVATSVLSAGAVTFMMTRLVFANARLGAAEARLAELRPVLQEIEDAERERAELKPKLTTLTDAQGRTSRWNGIMEGLKRVVPEQTWLTSISVEGQGEAARVMRVNGITINQSRVGETMYRLTQQPDFYNKVDLRYTRTTKLDQRDNVEFELAAELNQPELEKEKGEQDETQAN